MQRPGKAKQNNSKILGSTEKHPIKHFLFYKEWNWEGLATWNIYYQDLYVKEFAALENHNPYITLTAKKTQ